MDYIKNIWFVIVVILALTVTNAYSGTIAQTSFEQAEGFPGQIVNGGFTVTDTSGDYWECGAFSGNYAGVWGGAKHTGSMSAVFGNYGNPTPYLLADPAGAEGVGTVEFWIVKTGNVAIPTADPRVELQWSTDGTTWTTVWADRIDNTLNDTGWEKYSVAVNQAGDVKIRLYNPGSWLENGTSSHVSVDDVTISLSMEAGNVQPADGATGVLPTTILEWSAPSEYTPTGYDMYFGTNPTATANPKVVDNAPQTTYDPPGDIAFSTTYYWQVDTYNDATKYSGQPWSFTTKSEKIIKVACAGDSITYGYNIPDRENNSYPAQMQALLGSGYNVGNFGRSSARVSTTAWLPYTTTAEYAAALAFEPDIVFIALGINDCYEGQWQVNQSVFVNDYKYIINSFKSLPSNPTIYIGTTMPVFPNVNDYENLNANRIECDALIAQVASDEGLPLIDIYTRLSTHPEYYAVDGLHPTVDGLTILADDVYKAIGPNVYINGDITAVSEEGPTSDTYTIVLGGVPQQDVTLTLTPSESGQVVLEVDSVVTDTAVFTPANYDQPQTVTVTAVDDALYEAIHSVVISHSSSSVDSAYDNLVISDVSVNIADNEYYGKRVKVFLIGGQSNAAGSGLNTEYPAPYQSPQTDVEFWVGGRLTGDGVPDYSDWDRPADTAFRPLQLGSGNYLAGTHSGFEMSLGRALKDALPYDNIAIVKYGMSGSGLDRTLLTERGNWDSGPPTWSPSEGYAGVRYHVFMSSGVLPALQAITDRGDMPEIAGMFWMQGETDAGDSGAANRYEDNLNDLIASVRTELSAPDMRFVIGRIRTVMGTYNGTVRAAMKSVAASDPLAEWINTDDLAVNGDNVHYSAAGLVDMGERFANTYLSTLPKRGDVEPDGDIDLSDFARLAGQWLTVDCGFCFQADLNSDLDVSVEDFLIMTESWLEGSVPGWVARWSLDEGIGSVTEDLSPNHYDGTLVNFPLDDSKWLPSPLGYALQFDGVDDYVEAAGYKGVTGTQARTCSAWIKTATNQTSEILSWGDVQSGAKWMFRVNVDGTLGLGIWDGYSRTTQTVNDGSWHHVAVVLIDEGSPDISEVLFYIDGILQTDTYANNTRVINTASVQNVIIGARYDSGTLYDAFSGFIDDVRIYDRVLGVDEIQQIASW